MDGSDPLTERCRARVGSTLKGKWRLDQLLGVGGMAAVYRATHRNGKQVAVKILHPELSIDANIRQRFLREGYAANRVGHRGAVTVDDDDTLEDGSAFLVMELLEGETLDARLRRHGGRLPQAEVLALADQMLDTLAAAHEKEIVHRDLKPENVFLTREGTAKILDFGIARIRELSSGTNATQAGSVMGTPSFMPPEQARGRWEEVDARSDLWAVGATLFTLLTGRYVHEAETVNEALAQAITARARPVASLEPNLHPAVADLIDRALAYEKEARFSTTREMQSAVRRAYAELDGERSMPLLSVRNADGSAEVAASSEVRPATLTTGRGVSTSIGDPPETTPAAGRAISRRKVVFVAALSSIALLGAIVAWLQARGGPAPQPESSTAASITTVAPSPEPLPAQPTRPIVTPVEPTEKMTDTTSVDAPAFAKSQDADQKLSRSIANAKAVDAVGPVKRRATATGTAPVAPRTAVKATQLPTPTPATTSKQSNNDPFARRY